MRQFHFWLLASFFGFAHLASAAEPDAKKELDSLSFYAGSWVCQGVTFATATEAKQEWTARVEVKRELASSWYAVKMLGPDMNETSEHKGYDPKTRKWLHIWYGADPGSWGVLESSGWQGNKMVFTPREKTSPAMRAIFTKLSESEYSHREEESRGGKFVPVWEKTCSKKK